ncbi:MAG TPA: hypothetical protein VD905_08240, partial [Flavobacteriales bacterium]|nr:hypothetical protein [Flavobacteriales bacterium]
KENESKFTLLDSNALMSARQTIVLYRTTEYIILTTDSIFFTAFQRLFEKHAEDNYYIAIRDSLKEKKLLKIIYLNDLIYSISKNEGFFMSQLMMGKVLIYNKNSKKLEKHITCKQWHFTLPYNGYAKSYLIGKTEIYKDEEPWY